MPILKIIKRFLVGRPLNNDDIQSEKYGVLWGLPILSSDAISSVAYAGQEMLLVLIPAIGVLSYSKLSILSAAIIGILFLLMLSYRQTIDNYPNGGGAFVVSKENLGIIAGVTAGAALSVDYILTVAVSISSGVEQITSAITPLKKYSVLIAVLLTVILMVGNLRGIRESSKLFGIPAYAFIFALVSMIIAGLIKRAAGYQPPQPDISGSSASPVMLFLMLKAFSSGCTALTGIEAVSNAVPNFKDPSKKHAKTVLALLSLIILVLFVGTSILANIYRVVPGEKAMLILIAEQIFSHSFMYYFVTVTTFVILVLAANTAYSGFPMLISVMAREGYAPRQLRMRGDRLAYDNGILLLAFLSVILIIVFKANVTSLIGLYAIGVFISFTLSQTGMFVKWCREKGEHWKKKAFINGLGSIVTSMVVVVIAFTKFSQGAWVVVFLIPLLIYALLKVKRHYDSVYNQLRIKPDEFEIIKEEITTYNNRVIVLIDNINKASIRALKYAKTISNNIIAFNVVIDEESANEVRSKYDKLETGIHLEIKYSPYRKVVEPLLDFIESEEYNYVKGDIITVILPQFKVNKGWQSFLHNNTKFFIERQLLKHKHIVVASIPLQLKDKI